MFYGYMYLLFFYPAVGPGGFALGFFFIDPFSSKKDKHSLVRRFKPRQNDLKLQFKFCRVDIEDDSPLVKRLWHRQTSCSRCAQTPMGKPLPDRQPTVDVRTHTPPVGPPRIRSIRSTASPSGCRASTPLQRRHSAERQVPH